MQLLERYNWPGNVREPQNVIEQLVWLRGEEKVGVEELPPAIVAAANGNVARSRERRRQVADCLYEALVSRSCSFWEHVYPMFISRDLTRADLTGLVRRGLAATGGNYRALLTVLGMEPRDYKRFLNFLRKHDCQLPFKEYRQ